MKRGLSCCMLALLSQARFLVAKSKIASTVKA